MVKTEEVIPAKAGIQSRLPSWTPASAGVTAFLMVSCVVMLLAAGVHAESVSGSGSSVSVGASLFQKGRVRATITGGWGQAFNQDYLLIGGGVGYFLLRGFELGLDGEAWIGDDPEFQKVTPQIRYVFNALGSLFPYVGAFYRRTFYDGLDDLDSAGARVGAYAPIGRNVYVGGGAVFERQMNCAQDIYDHCSYAYPEFTISFVF